MPPIRHRDRPAASTARDEAAAFIDVFLPSREYWPKEIADSYEGSYFLPYAERLRLTCFLRCNGVPVNHVIGAMHGRLRDRSARTHVCSICRDIDSGNHPDNWFYYDTRRSMEVYVKSCVPTNSARYADFHRVMYDFEKYMDATLRNLGRYLTLHEQRAFFADRCGAHSHLAMM